MFDRADPHIHLFENGYQGSFTARPGVRIDETSLYASLAADHQVRQALVVGYEGDAWAKGNNAHVAAVATRHAWVRPVAYVEVLVEAFGTKRLLWGSDFPPSLDSLSFAQTIELFAEMPFISDEDRQAIEGGNLLRLLSEVRTGTITPN